MTLQEALNVLDLNWPPTRESLKAAYRENLFAWHPDRFEGNTEMVAKATVKTSRINEAYTIVSDKLEDYLSKSGKSSEAQQEGSQGQTGKGSPAHSPASSPSSNAPRETINPFGCGLAVLALLVFFTANINRAWQLSEAAAYAMIGGLVVAVAFRRRK
jgi:curved DNA-binding protein CbpA